LESDDIEDIKQKTEALKNASHSLAQTVYQNTQQQQGAEGAGAAGATGAAGAGPGDQSGAGGDGQSASGDYEDADYEVVNEEDESNKNQE
ncbi:MAG: molecular chaperone DnaK, partial [Spirochaetia bacterium]